MVTAAGLNEGVAAPVDFFTRVRMPYTLTNGTTVAANWADLTVGALPAPFDRDEKGNVVSADVVWTNTRIDRTVAQRSDR